MKIESVWGHGEEIPSRYTCDGEGVSPPLIISEVPEGTQSLALIVYDPDIPQFIKERFGIKEWIHWILFNIKAQTRQIPEAEGNLVGVAGANTNGKAAYSPPCPPDKRHRYAFRLYALNKILNLGKGATREGIEKAMEGSVITTTEMMGTYEKKK